MWLAGEVSEDARYAAEFAVVRFNVGEVEHSRDTGGAYRVGRVPVKRQAVTVDERLGVAGVGHDINRRFDAQRILADNQLFVSYNVANTSWTRG